MMGEQWPRVFEKDVEVYEAFSRAEDEGNRLLDRLLALIAFRNGVVLEIGCGSGKYTELIAPESRRFLAIDSSKRMIEFARNRCRQIGKVRFIHCNAEMMPIPSLSIDLVFASWTISGIVPEEARERAVNECLRVLKSDGHVWLVENDCGGEFMEMRDPASEGWDRENVAWLTEKHGFRIAERVKTSFLFPSVEDARRTMGFILGESALDYMERNPKLRFSHNVLILHKSIQEGR